MKHLLIFAIPVLVVGASWAQSPPTSKNVQTVNQSPKKNAAAKSKSATHVPTGPTGYGPLKIGMTKTAIEALQPRDGVYLVTPMIPAPANKPPLEEGVEKYQASVMTSLGNSGLATTFYFRRGNLDTLNFVLDVPSNMLDEVKAQIEGKYGVGSVSDDRKDEQCIYKNGANFKIKSGLVNTNWFEETSPGVQIKTTILEVSLDSCPPDLRDGQIAPPKLHILTIGVKGNQEDKSNNLF